jgi:hypothetical protein
MKFVASLAPQDSQQLDWHHLAYCSTSLCFNFGSTAPPAPYNEVNCAVVHPLNQSILFQSTALLASPSVVHRFAHSFEAPPPSSILSVAGGTTSRAEQSKQSSDARAVIHGGRASRARSSASRTSLSKVRVYLPAQLSCEFYISIISTRIP